MTVVKSILHGSAPIGLSRRPRMGELRRMAKPSGPGLIGPSPSVRGLPAIRSDIAIWVGWMKPLGATPGGSHPPDDPPKGIGCYTGTSPGVEGDRRRLAGAIARPGRGET